MRPTEGASRAKMYSRARRIVITMRSAMPHAMNREWPRRSATYFTLRDERVRRGQDATRPESPCRRLIAFILHVAGFLEARATCPIYMLMGLARQATYLRRITCLRLQSAYLFQY